MKIKKYISQHRRDFRAEYVCEHCGFSYEGSGYDDEHFHKKIIPNMKCKSCGEISPQDYKPRTTKYPDYLTV